MSHIAFLTFCEKCNEQFLRFDSIDKCISCRKQTKTDLEIAEDFFNMLKRNGVTIKEYIESNGNKSFTIVAHGWEDVEATEFSFFEDGDYWRIDGAVYGNNFGGYHMNKIHVQGWKRDKKD